MLILPSTEKAPPFGSAWTRPREDHLANILSHRESQHYGELLALLKQRGMTISPEAQRKARILRAAAAVAQKKLKPKED